MNPRLITAVPDVSLFGGLILILLINRFVLLLIVAGAAIWFVGALLLIVSLVVAFTVLLSLRRRRTSTSAGEVPSRLITRGPFRFSRNPYYLASAGLLLGVALLAGSRPGRRAPGLCGCIFNGSVARLGGQLRGQVCGGEWGGSGRRGGR